MRWSVTIPGQPVSWDAAYFTGRVPVKRRGVPQLREDGSAKLIHRPVMTDAGRQWKNDVQLLVQNARPRGWRPPDGQMRMIVDLYLVDDMDDDNALKLLRDAVEKAFGPRRDGKKFNDIQFLVCTRSKEIVSRARDARVELTFDDNPRAH